MSRSNLISNYRSSMSRLAGMNIRIMQRVS